MLRPHSIWVGSEPEPQIVRVANIQHLATPIHAQLAEPRSAIELAGLLHPTPAVGGEPRDRALRVLAAPGVTTVVAIDDGLVVGFAELFSDGELQAYLSNVAVDATRRGEGVGRRLVKEALQRAGGERIDLLSEDSSADFYRAFPHFEKPGFRLYPFHQDDPPPGE